MDPAWALAARPGLLVPGLVPALTPAALVAPVLVAVAVFVQEGLDENTGETMLTLMFLVIAGPFLTHATIRAARIREKGDWRPGQGGQAPPRQEAQ